MLLDALASALWSQPSLERLGAQGQPQDDPAINLDFSPSEWRSSHANWTSHPHQNPPCQLAFGLTATPGVPQGLLEDSSNGYCQGPCTPSVGSSSSCSPVNPRINPVQASGLFPGPTQRPSCCAPRDAHHRGALKFRVPCGSSCWHQQLVVLPLRAMPSSDVSYFTGSTLHREAMV